MNQSDIYCLFTKGGTLSHEQRTWLLQEANKLFHSGKSRRTFRFKTMHGEILTNKQWTRLGSTPGMKFSAKIECATGPLSVEYIVRPHDLEGFRYCDGQWNRIETFEELNSLIGEPSGNN